MTDDARQFELALDELEGTLAELADDTALADHQQMYVRAAHAAVARQRTGMAPGEERWIGRRISDAVLVIVQLDDDVHAAVREQLAHVDAACATADVAPAASAASERFADADEDDDTAARAELAQLREEYQAGRAANRDERAARRSRDRTGGARRVGADEPDVLTTEEAGS